VRAPRKQRILTIGAAAALAVASACPVAAQARAADGRFQVLHAEPVTIERLDARFSRARFDAYGRRFELELEPNLRLLARMDPASRAELASLRVLRGQIPGVPGSWVRLTVDGARQSGLVWDGRDLYVIEPAGDVAPRSVHPLGVDARKPVVYRLSDTLSDLGASSCTAVVPDRPASRTTGLDDYRALAAVLQQAAAVDGLAGRLQVSALADVEYVQSSGSAQAARSRIVEIFNSVDGIFSAQVGIEIELTGEIIAFASEPDPFSASAGSDLLPQLGDYREAQPLLRASGVTHLVTGRDLDGATVGIAYVGALCQSRFGASISQGSGTLTSLVAAHELGHNFGSPHDGESPDPGEPANPCESTPRIFLMSPQLNGSDQFSQCSLTQMEPEIRAASCILPVAGTADVALAASATALEATRGQSFPLQASVSSRGPADAASVLLTVTLPNGLSALDGSASAGGSCATEAGGIACSWPTLAAGVTATATVNLRADVAGTYSVPVVLTAASDASTGDDALSVTVTATAPGPVAPPAPASGGGGGGGGSGIILSLLLSLLALRRAGSPR
jgi:hypothetical protein